jgi:hypothetical protein
MGATESVEEPQQILPAQRLGRYGKDLSLLPDPVPRTLDFEKCAHLHNKILDTGWAAVDGSRKQRSWWDYYFGVLDPSKHLWYKQEPFIN